MANESNNDKCCPFWDSYATRTCLLVESGLFIPTREHILHFCENESYITCYHYIGKSSPQVKPEDRRESRSLQNRRQYTRIPTRQKLSVARYSLAKEENEDIIDHQALALDLSLGGMRIETDAPIYVNQIISFCFDEEFHPPGYKGKGEIRWIDPDKSEATSGSAGLAFIDNDTKNTVRNHLLGMGDRLLRLSGF